MEAALNPSFIWLLVVAAVLALALLTWLHHWFWQRRLAPTTRPDELHYVRTADGWRIGLRRYRPKGEGPRFAEPVILCHGLGANHFNLDWEPPYGLAQYLAEQGRDCWVISLRAHGPSDRPSRQNGLKWGFGFDDYLRYDVPAALEYVLERTGAERVQWVGHSMGGMLAYALGGTQWEGALAGGLAAIGSPASFANQPYLRALTRLGVWLAGKSRIRQRWLTQMIAPFMGHFDLPFSELTVAPKSMDGKVLRGLQASAFEDISAGVIRQFHDWVVNDAFRSEDRKVDYQERMAAFRAPVLVIGGTADLLVPPPCIEAAFERLGSEDKTLVVLGKKYGSPVEYGHGDLVFGKAAPNEVFPLIEGWLRERARPVEEAH